MAQPTSQQSQRSSDRRRPVYKERVTIMKPLSTQFGVRENTASPRQHDLRLATYVRPNSNCTKEQALQTRTSASDNGTSTADLPNPCNAAPPRSATAGETGEAAPLAANRSGRETRFGIERPLTCEEAAELVRVHPKTVKRMARSGNLPGHFRFGRWFFYASELDGWMRTELHSSRHSCR
jgi:excisionase family DNA binding protein